MRKTKSLMIICVFAVILLASYLSYHSAVSQAGTTSQAVQNSNNSGNTTGIHGIPTLMPQDFTDPATAAQYGISGYVSVDVVPGAPQAISVSGGEASIMIALKFVSYWKNLTETDVTLDPHSSGLQISMPYGSSMLCLNDLVSYNPHGTVTIKAGQTLLVNMTVTVPADYPIVSFPLRAVGITSNTQIIDNMNLTANV